MNPNSSIERSNDRLYYCKCVVNDWNDHFSYISHEFTTRLNWNHLTSIATHLQVNSWWWKSMGNIDKNPEYFIISLKINQNIYTHKHTHTQYIAQKCITFWFEENNTQLNTHPPTCRYIERNKYFIWFWLLLSLSHFLFRSFSRNATLSSSYSFRPETSNSNKNNNKIKRIFTPTIAI